jgi:hypothetical protein
VTILAEETLTLKQIYEEVANLDILDMVVPVTREGKNLVLTPEILAMFKPDVNGRLHPIVDTSGKGPVVENSATAILTALDKQPILKNLLVSLVGTFEGGLNTETDAWRAQHKFFNTPLQASGAGTLASVALVPPVASHRACMRIWGIWSDKTDGSVVFDFSTSTGLTTGPTSLDVALVANKVTDYAPGILWEGSAINEQIDIVTAAGQCQADQKFLMLGDWWSEL